MPVRVCIVCGREFNASHGARRLCGPECRRQQLLRQRSLDLARRRQRPPGPVLKRCIICNRPFLAGKGCKRAIHAKCCSMSCQQDRGRQKTLEGQARMHALATRKCVACGKLFRAIDRPRKRTCSDECARQLRRDQRWRQNQRRIASGKGAAYDAKRRATGYCARYKRQWRRRRAEERAKLEILLIGAALGA